MDRTEVNDRARRFIASVCAYGLTIIVSFSLQPTCANASRWSEAASQEPAVPATDLTTPATAAPPLTTAPPEITAAPAATAAVAVETAPELPSTPGLRRLPPVTPETAPPSVAAKPQPVRVPPAAPIDWRRPSMVMGPLPGESTPHQSQVRLISDVVAVTPEPATKPAQASPKIATSNHATEIMPAHTTPENGASQPEPSTAEAEPTPSTPVVASRYSHVTTPAVVAPAPTIMPRYAVTTELANPAETTLAAPAEKPHFARVTDESISAPAPKDGLSPIYVCRLLGLKAAQ